MLHMYGFYIYVGQFSFAIKIKDNIFRKYAEKIAMYEHLNRRNIVDR